MIESTSGECGAGGPGGVSSVKLRVGAAGVPGEVLAGGDAATEPAMALLGV